LQNRRHKKRHKKAIEITQTLSVALTILAIVLFTAAALASVFLKTGAEAAMSKNELPADNDTEVKETVGPASSEKQDNGAAKAKLIAFTKSEAGSKASTPASDESDETIPESEATAQESETTKTEPDPIAEVMESLKRRVRNKDSVIPDGPSFEEISPDGIVDYSRLPYDSVVPEGPKVPDDYFDDALFIGNSIQQIQHQIGRLNASFMTTGDFNIYRYFEWLLRTPEGDEQVVSDYVEQNRFGKIYLGFGVNEVSYENQERMWQGYRDMLAHVKAHQPDAIIYLQGVLPVYPPLMEEVAKELITPEKILEFNHKLAILAEDEGVYMVNPAEAVQDENGWLDEEWSFDGVHFGPTATEIWDTYLEYHAILPEQSR
jgi:hypothetical protein